MSLDLRGHGNSLIKNQRPLQASPDWRANPREFPLDIDPPSDWFKNSLGSIPTRLLSSDTTSVRILP